MDLAPRFVEHLAGELWPPEVEASEHGEYHGTEYDVVEVSDDKIGVCDMEVQWGRCEDNASHSSEEEGDHETQGPQHWCLKRDRSSKHRANPVDELDTGWYRNEHAHQREERQED